MAGHQYMSSFEICTCITNLAINRIKNYPLLLSSEEEQNFPRLDRDLHGSLGPFEEEVSSELEFCDDTSTQSCFYHIDIHGNSYFDKECMFLCQILDNNVKTVSTYPLINIDGVRDRHSAILEDAPIADKSFSIALESCMAKPEMGLVQGWYIGEILQDQEFTVVGVLRSCEHPPYPRMVKEEPVSVGFWVIKTMHSEKFIHLYMHCPKLAPYPLQDSKCISEDGDGINANCHHDASVIHMQDENFPWSGKILLFCEIFYFLDIEVYPPHDT
eukprot:6368758-Ditylum_brightwellii.AAC.1